MNFFKPEDFEIEKTLNYSCAHGLYGQKKEFIEATVGLISIEKAAEQANAKLERESKKVVGYNAVWCDEHATTDQEFIHVREVLPEENKIDWNKVWVEFMKWQTESEINSMAQHNKIQELVEKSLEGKL